VPIFPLLTTVLESTAAGVGSWIRLLKRGGNGWVEWSTLPPSVASHFRDFWSFNGVFSA